MRYRVFGQVEVDGTAISSPQERRLLALLLLNRNRPVSVSQAEEGIWLNAAPARARGALQSKISRLRNLVGQSNIRYTEAGYTLVVAPGECDADRFEEIADVLARDPDLQGRARLERIDAALALWRGEVFGDLANEPFVGGEAIRLEQRRAAVTEDQVVTLLELGRLDGALAVLGPLLELHRYNDRLCELRMRALARSGRPVDAVRAFQDHRRRLRDEVGMEPTAALTELEREILDENVAADNPRLGSSRPPIADRMTRLGLRPVDGARWNEPIVTRPSFVAREEIVATIRRTLIARSGPAALLMIGDGGIGKTRLAMEAVRLAHRAERATEVLRCRAQSAALFAPLAHLGGPAIDWTATEARQQAVAHYTEVLRTRLSTTALLIVEDLHWADEGTLDVLDSLANLATNDDLDVVVMLTSRPLPVDGTVGPRLSRLARDLSTITVELDGLSEPETFQLIERACATRPDIDLTDRLHDRSAGNPLLTLTGLQNLRGQGALRFDGERLRTTAGAITTMPADLSDSLDQVLHQLGGHTRQLLVEVAASVAEPTVDELPSSLTRSAADNAAAIDEAERAGLVVNADDRLRIRHELYRRVIVERLTSKEQHDLHHAMFLHHRPDDPSPADSEAPSPASVFALAHHAERAGARIDEATRYRVYVRAGFRALTGTDWARAAHFYRAAQALATDLELTDVDRLRLHAFTGMALFRTHDAVEALPLLDAVIDEAERHGEPELWGLALADHHRAAFTLTKTVPRPSPERIANYVDRHIGRAPAQCARLLALSAEHHFSYGDNDEASELASRAMAIAEEEGDELLNAEVIFASGLVALGELALDDAAHRFTASATAAEGAGSMWTASWGLGRMAFVRLLEGDFDAAWGAARIARAAQSSAASWAELSFTAALEAQLAYLRGDADDVVDRINEAERLLHRTGYAFSAQFIYPLLLREATLNGDIESYDEIIRRWTDVPSRPPRVFAAIRSTLAGAADNADQIAALRPLGPQRLGPGHLVTISAQFDLAVLSSNPRIVSDTDQSLDQLERAGVVHLPAQRTPIAGLRQELAGLDRSHRVMPAS